MGYLLLDVLVKDAKKNVVVYGGTKTRCRLIEKKLSDMNIYFMDLEEEMNIGSDKKLYSFSQVAEKNIDAFLVLRQMISHQHTFNEMLQYCEQYGADIYDENGRNLSKICKRAVEKANSDKTEIMQKVFEHERISFDIFDTLLTRKVLVPEDVFELVERKLGKLGIVIKNFKEKRIKIQSDMGLTNPNIYDIYAKFQKKYKISKETVDLCCKLEIETEHEVLTPRKDMLEVYNSCIKAGKKVSLVSDMYLPAEVLVPILEAKGIRNYEKLYISCDYKKLKLQGLLAIYKGEMAAESYLHIGDHVIHDGICAGLEDIDYCLISHGYKQALKSSFKECIERAETLEEHIMLGLAIEKIFNSPFRQVNNQNKIWIDSDFDYGYVFCAPLLSKFAMWMYEKVRELEADDILFASRDGYLLQKMYDLLRNKKANNDMPEGKYFYTSRKAAVMTCINNEAYINMLIDMSFDMPPRKMMKERFGLYNHQIRVYDKAKYEIVHPYVWEHAPEIFKRAEEARLNYFKYMGKCGMQIGKKYAFMDFVSSGTCQKSLMKIAPFEMLGVYAGWNSAESKAEFQIHSLYDGNTSFFMRHYKMMETFLTSKEPSLSHFDKNGNPVFSTQDRNEKELEYVQQMQDACINYFEELLKIEPLQENISIEFADRLFAVSENVEFNCKESVLNNLSLMDDWRRKRNKVDKMIQ